MEANEKTLAEEVKELKERLVKMEARVSDIVGLLAEKDKISRNEIKVLREIIEKLLEMYPLKDFADLLAKKVNSA